MLIYLGLSAVVVFVAALVLLQSASLSPPAVAHLVLAVGIAPLILGAITHFMPVLTRSGRPRRGLSWAPLLLQCAGGTAFFGFTGTAPPLAMVVAAVVMLLVALLFAGWLMSRARRTLGRPHPGWRWYLAAIVCLSLAMALVPAINGWPEMRQELRLLHLHLNALGFIGLSALGTLQVLLPTVLSGPDADAAARLRRDLPMAGGAVLGIALGAAFAPALAIASALMLLSVVLRTGVSWSRRYGWRTLLGDGGAAALLAALVGYSLLLVFGMAHAFGVVEGQDAVPAFVVAFLMPLVTGALSQLLPVWRHPGRRTCARERMLVELRRGGAARSLLFVVSGSLLALGAHAGIWLAAAGMLFFVIALLGSLAVARNDPGTS
ncbi:MAG: hypothetical protein JNK06_00665 [Candidatus Accumulibacter phosphatis]|uniref:hypothetical protein n=1 Tax=Candidatus Accumulibacter phosphatis TaxID=327160 RepID=UPI001A395E55|nr:hypothetical protein [Candidatus Accumulibacter phosphatis]